MVSNFEIETVQQDAYYDNFIYFNTAITPDPDPVPVPDTIFSDNFTTDTINEYNIVNTWTAGGTGNFSFDNTSKRALVLTGNDIGLKFSHELDPLENGNFSFDFYPEKYYPNGGIIILRLIQDKNNYYELKNSDGYGPGYIAKFVDGKKVDQTAFENEFSQKENYKIDISFSPNSTKVIAFGEQIEIKNNTQSIMVSNFEIETKQQDAYYDNFIYNQF